MEVYIIETIKHQTRKRLFLWCFPELLCSVTKPPTAMPPLSSKVKRHLKMKGDKTGLNLSTILKEWQKNPNFKQKHPNTWKRAHGALFLYVVWLITGKEKEICKTITWSRANPTALTYRRQRRWVQLRGTVTCAGRKDWTTVHKPGQQICLRFSITSSSRGRAHTQESPSAGCWRHRSPVALTWSLSPPRPAVLGAAAGPALWLPRLFWG